MSLTTNLVDQVWASSRPARPKNTVFPLPVEYAGQSSEEKIKKIREEITKQKALALVVNTLDEVAWLFNLRGSDIDYNPGMLIPFRFQTSNLICDCYLSLLCICYHHSDCLHAVHQPRATRKPWSCRRRWTSRHRRPDQALRGRLGRPEATRQRRRKD